MSKHNPDIGSLVISDNLSALVKLQIQGRWAPSMIDLATALKHSAHVVTTYVMLSTDTLHLDALISLSFYSRNARGLRAIILAGGTLRTRKHREFLRTSFLKSWSYMAKVLLDGFRRNDIYTTRGQFLHDFEVLTMVSCTCKLTRQIMDDTYGCE
jgi:hypothetical protein